MPRGIYFHRTRKTQEEKRETLEAKNARRRENYQTYGWAYHLRKSYGITPEQYEEKLKSQGGVCAICLNPPKKRRLHYDHNHSTGQARELICYRCNHVVLGGIHDRGDIALRLAAYLVKWFSV